MKPDDADPTAAAKSKTTATAAGVIPAADPQRHCYPHPAAIPSLVFLPRHAFARAHRKV